MIHLHAEAQQIRSNVSGLRSRINDAALRGGQPANQVKILAATKYVDLAGVAALYEAGVDILGENRVPALMEKHTVAPDATWHFIGRMQSRQVRDVAPIVACIQTLCSESAARQLGSMVSTHDVLLQVNTAGDPAKDGLQPADVDRFIDQLPENVRVMGLMTMPAFADDPELSRPSFAALREICDALRDTWSERHPLNELSMGTSQDHLVGVEEGSTIVRLGRVLFVPGEQ